MTGKIVSFSRMHGYGFVLGDDDEYVLFHVKAWNDYMKCKIGDRVEYTKEITPKGARATAIRRER